MIKLADLHCDTFYECFVNGRDIYDKSLHINLPAAKNIRPYIQTFAHYIPDKLSFEEKFDFFEKMVSNSHKIINNNDDFMLFKSKEDIFKAEKENKILCVLSVEGGDFFDDDFKKNEQRIKKIKEYDIKILSLCYNKGSSLLGGAFDDDKHLSDIGKKVIDLLNEYNIIIDISHTNTKSGYDVIKYNKMPTIATHSNCKAISPHSRNLTDDEIKSIINKGGLIGINFYPKFLSDDEFYANMKDIYNHISYILSLGGQDVLAFGADLDGVDYLPRSIESVNDFERLYVYLNKMGISENLLEKIFIKNVIDFIKNIEV